MSFNIASRVNLLFSYDSNLVGSFLKPNDINGYVEMLVP